MKIHAGFGTQVTQIGRHALVSAPSRQGVFASAFAVLYCGDFFLVNYGTVNDIEPTIDGKPISGVDADGRVMPNRPQIGNPQSYDTEGRLWISVKVAVDEKGRIASSGNADAVTVVAGRSARDNTPTEAYYAIAVLRRNGELYQIAHFNLRYRGVIPKAGPLRHFFWSV
jgi:hypothetical protein